jgi:arsenate reductase-like glutaredoxin family protein
MTHFNYIKSHLNNQTIKSLLAEAGQPVVNNFMTNAKALAELITALEQAAHTQVDDTYEDYLGLINRPNMPNPNELAARMQALKPTKRPAVLPANPVRPTTRALLRRQREIQNTHAAGDAETLNQFEADLKRQRIQEIRESAQKLIKSVVEETERQVKEVESERERKDKADNADLQFLAQALTEENEAIALHNEQLRQEFERFINAPQPPSKKAVGEKRRELNAQRRNVIATEPILNSLFGGNVISDEANNERANAVIQRSGDRVFDREEKLITYIVENEMECLLYREPHDGGAFENILAGARVRFGRKPFNQMNNAGYRRDGRVSST